MPSTGAAVPSLGRQKGSFQPSLVTKGWCLHSWCSSAHLCSRAIPCILTTCGQTLISLLFSQCSKQLHPFPSSQRRCVCSGCRQRAPLSRGLGWNPPATNSQGQKHPLQLCQQGPSHHSVPRKEQQQRSASEGSLCKLSILLLFVFS